MYNVREKKIEPRMAGWERELLVADRDRQLERNIFREKIKRFAERIGL